MQYLLCRIGAAVFALDALQVHKIADCQPLTRLPYVPAYIDGLVNIEGEVIVQLNLPRLLGSALATAGELVVVNVSGYLMALCVDKALEKADIDDDTVTALGAGEAGQADYLTHEISRGSERFLVFNLASLAGLLRPAEAEEGGQGFLARNRAKQVRQAEDQISFLTFMVNGERLGMPLLKIHEVIELSCFSHLPGAPSQVAGLASLRGQPLLVISVARLLQGGATAGGGHDKLGHADGANDDAATVVVVPFADTLLGLQVDRLCGIEHFVESALKREQSAASLVDAYAIDRDDNITLLLNLETLAATAALREIMPFVPSVKKTEASRQVTTIKLLRVQLANELCAIPVEQVVRLAEYRNATPIEQNDRGIVGSVDIDGRIIPLLNINKRLNVANDEHFEQLVVIEHGNSEWALCVNEAQMLFDLDVELIDDCTQRPAVRGIASHHGELVSILDFDWLLSTA